ncbi:MAG: hypothetical protein ACREER_08410 [Alphaproteobacteria bacterium]
MGVTGRHAAPLLRAVFWAVLGAVLGITVGVGPAFAGEDFVPEMSPEASQVEHEEEVFAPDPSYADEPYDIDAQVAIYGGKREVVAPRPLLEAGREIYTAGPFQPAYTFLGDKNPVIPRLYIYGDVQTVLGYADNGATELGQLAARLNLDVDFQITSTERIHAFLRPLDHDGAFTRCELFGGDDDDNCNEALSHEIQTLFFEGDVGPIAMGLTGEENTIDLPFAAGFTPMLLQNGIWLEDAAIGGAVTVPFRHSRALDISNMDITAFAFVDEVDSRAFRNSAGGNAQHGVNVFGATTFIEATEGYWELGYGYSAGEGRLDPFSYHNLTAAFTKRYFNRLNNSLRVIWNVGQDPDPGSQQTADGVALFAENSLIVNEPATIVPYLNLFAGFDRPQGLGQQARGILKNTGVNFETDAITQFPKLDDSGNDTWGGAIGLEYLFALDQQVVVEFATNQVMGSRGEPGRPAFDDEYAVGLRYQIPITKAWIVRADAIYGWRDGIADIRGARLEIRRKF